MDIKPDFDDVVINDSALNPSGAQSQPDQENQLKMTSSQVSLVPANLAARSPVQWSVKEVKAWLEFCATEFSLPQVSVNKFDMNGKALTLLTKQDFIERAPNAGDVLYNVFQLCLQQESPSYLRSPVLLSTPTHVHPPITDILPRLPHTQGFRSTYVPIRPQISPFNCKPVHPTNNVMLAVIEDSVSPTVPASMLSPAPSEKCPSESDSTQNENGHSPNSSDQEMEFVDNVNYKPEHNAKFDMPDQNDDGVCRLLWEFLYQLLQDEKWSELVSWESKEELTFRILNPNNLADAWGKQKNRSNMTYEKLSRALRYYYKMNIIKKVQGKKLTYKFLQHPAKIRRGQRGARPHSNRQSKSKAAETDHAVRESTTPDSSTFIPTRNISVSSTESALLVPSIAHMRGEQSPEDHTEEPLDKKIKLTFNDDVHSQHLQDSSLEVQGNTLERRSVLCHGVAEPSGVSKQERSLRIASPGCNSELSYNHQSNRFDTCLTYAPENVDSEAVTIRGCLNSSSNDTFLDDHRFESIYNEQMKRMHNYGLVHHGPLLSLDQRSHLFTNNDHTNKFCSNQYPTTEKDVFSRGPSTSPLSASGLTFRSRSPLMYNEMNFLTDNKYVTLYPHSYHRLHPYLHPLPLSRTSSLPTYNYQQQNHKNVVSDLYSSILNNDQKIEATTRYRNSPDHITHSTKDSLINNQLKLKISGHTQDEPEDLSVKPRYKKGTSKENTPQQESGTHETVIKSTQRRSPQSNSPDSAYNSDITKTEIN